MGGKSLFKPKCHIYALALPRPWPWQLPKMSYADVVATLAPIFSLIAFLWNVFHMERWQKPAISIQHSAFIYESTLAPDGSNTVYAWNMPGTRPRGRSNYPQFQ
jgi:hypothetical protein